MGHVKCFNKGLQGEIITSRRRGYPSLKHLCFWLQTIHLHLVILKCTITDCSHPVLLLNRRPYTFFLIFFVPINFSFLLPSSLLPSQPPVTTVLLSILISSIVWFLNPTYKWEDAMFAFRAWLISLNIMIFSSIMLLEVTGSHSFSGLNGSPLCICTTISLFIHLWMDA